MTLALDDLRARDARIAELEAIPEYLRTRLQVAELSRLHVLRERYWKRFDDQLATVRRRLRDMETYGRDNRLQLDRVA